MSTRVNLYMNSGNGEDLIMKAFLYMYIAFLSLPLILKEQFSVDGERMCINWSAASARLAQEEQYGKVSTTCHEMC